MKYGAYEIARYPKYDWYQSALASMVYKFFDKKSSVNEELIQELHKPVIKKFKRRVYVTFKDNIWAADLADWNHYVL